MNKKFLVIVLHKNSPRIWEDFLEHVNTSQNSLGQAKNEHLNGVVEKSKIEKSSAIKINGFTENIKKPQHISGIHLNKPDNISLSTSSQCVNTDFQPSNCTTSSKTKSSKARKKKKKSASACPTPQPLPLKPTFSISSTVHEQTSTSLIDSTFPKDSQSTITYNSSEGIFSF